MSSLTIESMASVTRLTLAGSGSSISSRSRLGATCQQSPQRSRTQPHYSIAPPSDSASHSRSSSAWVSGSTMIEKLWLNGSSGPASMAM